MDLMKNMILIFDKEKNKLIEKTSEVESIRFDSGFHYVRFYNSDLRYSYRSENVYVLLNEDKRLDISDKYIYINGELQNNVTFIQLFKEYARVWFNKSTYSTHSIKDVKIVQSVKNNQTIKNCINYFSRLTEAFGTGDEKSYLKKQYEKMEMIHPDSVLSSYIIGRGLLTRKNTSPVIFPFGFNGSQKQATINALENNISIIEGPPGTGKTQTILNIIANLIIRGKSVAIVSNNNSATANVFEKLKKYGFQFLVAKLGNKDNVNIFFENINLPLPEEIKTWDEGINKHHEKYLSEKLEKIETINQIKNQISFYRKELNELQTEKIHFLSQNEISEIEICKNVTPQYSKSKTYLKLIAYLAYAKDKNATYSIWTKIVLISWYYIKIKKFIRYDTSSIINYLQYQYYLLKEQEISKSLVKMKKQIEGLDAKKEEEWYQEVSLEFFRKSINQKFKEHKSINFTNDNYKSHFNQFLNRFPIVISTTYAIRQCISNNYLFDYLIVDESSQVDLVTAALAMSSCNNIVVVGDSKQLPQIVPHEIKVISDKLKIDFSIPNEYDYASHNMLSSLKSVFGLKIPSILLREHYRCHPQIIEFCNKKYYNDQLICMTQKKDEDSSIFLYITQPGEHARKSFDEKDHGWYNDRQIDVIYDEILTKELDIDQIGIISPYRIHVSKIKSRTKYSDNLEVDTVHKFQGREKNTIIFTTVTNNNNPFVDDPNLINVAVSRAKSRFYLIVSDEISKLNNGDISDLVKYIQYYGGKDSCVVSEIVSIFDILYQDYAQVFEKYPSTRKKSEFLSENLVIKEVEKILLEDEKYQSIDYSIHVPLQNIAKANGNLNQEEMKFISNDLAHVDCILHNKFNKSPLLVIEVDGVSFHRNPTQQKRDQMKNSILNKLGISYIRIKTTDINVKEKIKEKLNLLIGVD